METEISYRDYKLSRIWKNISYYIFFVIFFMVFLIFVQVDVSQFNTFESLVYVFMVVIIVTIFVKHFLWMDIWYFSIGTLVYAVLGALKVNLTIAQVISFWIIGGGVTIEILLLFKDVFPKFPSKKNKSSQSKSREKANK